MRLFAYIFFTVYVLAILIYVVITAAHGAERPHRTVPSCGQLQSRVALAMEAYNRYAYDSREPMAVIRLSPRARLAAGLIALEQKECE